MTKILFTDIDGTLLKSDGTISPKMHQALMQMSQIGHRLVLTSGRPLAGILKVKNDLGLSFPYSYIIANNGSLVYDCDAKKAILEKRLPFSVIDIAQKIADRLQIHLQTYAGNSIVCKRETPEVLSYSGRIPMQIIYSQDLLAPLTEEPYKLLAIHRDGSEYLEDFRKEIEHALGNQITTLFSGRGYLEIIEKSASKGNALRFLCDKLNIPISASVAAGDSENDISMLNASGIGIAMQNSSDLVKASADYITVSDNNHDGLLEAIERFIFI